MARGGLTPKQEAFVREYLLDLNATQAAIRAGYSAKTAKTIGPRLLENVGVQEAITAGRMKTAERLELTREAVIRQYQRIGFSDPRKMFDANGQLKPITELDDDTAAAIQAFDVEMKATINEDGEPVSLPVAKIKIADRKTALDSIMKAQGWNLPDQVEVAGKGGGAIQHEHRARVVIVPPKVAAEVETRSLPRDEVDL